MVERKGPLARGVDVLLFHASGQYGSFRQDRLLPQLACMAPPAATGTYGMRWNPILRLVLHNRQTGQVVRSERLACVGHEGIVVRDDLPDGLICQLMTRARNVSAYAHN